MRDASEKSALVELGGLFLRLGVTAFGGPAAHTAMMEDEVVRRRGWLSQSEFLDLVGATNLIPGPNSTELAIHIGVRRGGLPGLLVAGACFILPAALMVTLIAWLYVKYGKLPESAALLYGIKPVIIAIIVQALWRLGPSALKTKWLMGMAVLCIAANLLGVHELVVLFGAGTLNLMIGWGGGKRPGLPLFALAAPILPGSVAASGAVTSTAFSLSALFFFFLKVGSVLFGSGYVLLAFLRADLVERWGWLTEAQLLDAVAVGQITPGPVFTTATFIGFILAGGKGAVLATLGIFLPAFVFVALSGALVPKMRKSRAAGLILDGLNVSSLALMAVVMLQIARAAFVDVVTVVIGIVAAFVLVRYKLNSAWLVAAGAAIGIMKMWIGR